MSYATPTQILQVYDARTIGDLCSDTGVRVSPLGLLTDTVLQQQLNSASGKIDSALMAGGMYKPKDLQSLIDALNNNVNTDSTAYVLISVCCDVAMLMLMMRRPGYDMVKIKQMIDLVDGPTGSLTKLRRGENVFGLPDNIDAGQPSIDGPTTLTYQNLNLMRDRARNYYPQRVNPYNR